MNLLNLYETNRICPRCKNPNYMVSLGGVSNDIKYKCMNCNSYFTYDDLTLKTSTIKNDMVKVVRCKDCKFAHKTYDGDCKYCDMFTDDDGNLIERYRSGDWFCADGVKRND